MIVKPSTETIDPLSVSFFGLALQPSKYTEKLQKNGSLISQIGARAIFALQVVINLAALPIILMLGLGESAYQAVTGEGKIAKDTLVFTGKTLAMDLVLAPAFFLAAFTTGETAEAYFGCMEVMREKVVSCFTSTQTEDEALTV